MAATDAERPETAAEALAVSVSIVDSERQGQRRAVAGFLAEAAERAGHPFTPLPLDLTAQVDGRQVGGLSGQLLYGWLWVMLLAVAPDQQGRGVGSALLAAAEDWARGQGGLGVNVDTYAHQAPGFYQRLGYVEEARLPGRVAAEDRIYLVKPFVSP